MNITESQQDGITLFALDGRIDSDGAAELDQTLQTAVARGRYKLVIDMSEVKYLNSAGLRTLADILTQTRTHNGDLRLVALSPKVERVFRIIGFDKFFEEYASVEDALANF